MKYNVFKRPMFKRGGISRGTGITSGLDTPRIGFSNGMGFGFMSAGQQFPIEYHWVWYDPESHHSSAGQSS